MLPYLFDRGKAEAVEAFASTHRAPAFPAWIVRAGAHGVVEEVVVVQRGPRWPECGFTGIGVASAAIC